MFGQILVTLLTKTRKCWIIRRMHLGTYSCFYTTPRLCTTGSIYIITPYVRITILSVPTYRFLKFKFWLYDVPFPPALSALAGDLQWDEEVTVICEALISKLNFCVVLLPLNVWIKSGIPVTFSSNSHEFTYSKWTPSLSAFKKKQE